MPTISDKIYRGMTRQLVAWREIIAHGHHRVGWKIGFGMRADQQRMKLPTPMIGYLTTDGLVKSGAAIDVKPKSNLLVEPEIAMLIGKDVSSNATKIQATTAIESYCAAIEIVDTTRSVNDDIEAMLAGNLFHEAVVFSDRRIAAGDFLFDQLTATLRVNDKEVSTLESSRLPEDFASIVLLTAKILETQGERLLAGDRIITGAISKPVGVIMGDKVELEMGQLGSISLRLA